MELRWIAVLALWTIFSGPVFSPMSPTPAVGPRAGPQDSDSSEAVPRAPSAPDASESR